MDSNPLQWATSSNVGDPARCVEMSPLIRAFLFVLLRRPSAGLDVVRWWIAGRRVRARGRLIDAASRLPGSDRLWRGLYQPERIGARSRAELARETPDLPLVALHLHLASAHDASLLGKVAASLTKQFFTKWEAFVTAAEGVTPDRVADPRINVLSGTWATPTVALAHALQVTNASYLVPLRANCTLTPGALLAYARAIGTLASGEEALFYADQDERTASGQRCNPWLKPEWDEDLFLAQDYVSAACAVPTSTACAVLENAARCPATLYDVIAELLLSAKPIPVRHVRYIATTTPADTWREASRERLEDVRRIAADRFGARVEPGPFGTLVLHRPLPTPEPLVSVIVPTRDRLDLLVPCVEGVLNATDYDNLELIVADNDSVEPETRAFLDQMATDPRVTIVRWPHPYNYAAINNFAVTQARGQYICLLNNDTEVIDPAWLRMLMTHAARRDAGAVGARLLYPDRTIQHAGVVIGMGGAAGHAHRGLIDGEPGYFAQAYVARGATAVTAACLVVARSKFDAVAGLDEADLAIAYNDVDLCLKLRAAGWRNLYVPQAVLIHHESKSRGLDLAPENAARYGRELATLQQRWGTQEFVDPTHHPALDRASEVYRVKI